MRAKQEGEVQGKQAPSPVPATSTHLLNHPFMPRKVSRDLPEMANKVKRSYLRRTLEEGQKITDFGRISKESKDGRALLPAYTLQDGFLDVT